MIPAMMQMMTPAMPEAKCDWPAVPAGDVAEREGTRWWDCRRAVADDETAVEYFPPVFAPPILFLINAWSAAVALPLVAEDEALLEPLGVGLGAASSGLAQLGAADTGRGWLQKAHYPAGFGFFRVIP